MSAKTKIVVVKAKELIYTALFVCLGIILILLLIFMFAPEEKSTKTSAGVYTPGVYTSTITLGDNTLDVAVSVDADHITSVSLNHLSDSVSAIRGDQCLLDRCAGRGGRCDRGVACQF